MKFAFLFIIMLPAISFSQVDLKWVDSLDADFSFTEEWDYPEGVYVNQWGQLSCDGLCPMEIDRMKDDLGRIYDDSLEVFYTIIDTTHIYRSHSAEVRAYEYFEVNHVICSIENGRVRLETICDAGNHSWLVIEFDENPKSVTPHRAFIFFNSVRANTKVECFNVTVGTVELSKAAWENAVVEMVFDLEFNSGEEKLALMWKGKIRIDLPSIK